MTEVLYQKLILFSSIFYSAQILLFIRRFSLEKSDHSHSFSSISPFVKSPLSIFGIFRVDKKSFEAKEVPLCIFFGIVRPHSFSTLPNSCFILKTLSYFVRVLLGIFATEKVIKV